MAEDNVMAELYNMSKEMTGAPSQDNTSWFWLSNPKIADWYDEHNYYNNNQWEKYLLKTLPAELDKLPPKPFLIGEIDAVSPWPDTRGAVQRRDHAGRAGHRADGLRAHAARAAAQRPDRHGRARRRAASPRAAAGPTGSRAATSRCWSTRPSCARATTPGCPRAGHHARLPDAAEQLRTR